mgnify:CR=1 FL=1
MLAKVTIGTDGKLSIITQEGTFEGGKKAIERFLTDLGLNGLPFEVTSEKDFEQHHDDPAAHAHVHQHVHEH